VGEETYDGQGYGGLSDVLLRGISHRHLEHPLVHLNHEFRLEIPLLVVNLFFSYKNPALTK